MSHGRCSRRSPHPGGWRAYQGKAEEVAPPVHGGESALQTERLAEEDADRNAELVEDANCAADADRGNVREVHWRDDGGNAAANADEEAA